MTRLTLALLLAASLQAAHARTTGNPYLELLIVDGIARPLGYDDLPLKPALDADPALRARMDKHGRGPCDIRGYHATWEIRDDTLYLVKLRLGCDEFRDVPLSLLFPGQRSPVPASWFTGQLTLTTTRSALPTRR